MVKLIDLLKEIGEATAKPYDWKQTSNRETYKEYMFETKSGLDYKVEIDVLKDSELAFVDFGIIDSEEDQDEVNFDVVPTRGELFSVMATIVEVLKNFIKNNPNIKYLEFGATKGKGNQKKSNARLSLYTKYIQKHLPNATIKTDPKKGYDWATVQLKEIGEATAKPYDWRQTSNEEEYKEYTFKTDSGLYYQLDIDIKEQDKERDTAVVGFGIMKANDDDGYFKDYDETPSRGELYRVMATVVGILKDFIKKNKGIKYLHFTTNKIGSGETKRLALYKQYIQKHLPNADIETKNRYGAEVTTITLK